jgi:glycosyltransferase involved in cell wall biosynthesis
LASLEIARIDHHGRVPLRVFFAHPSSLLTDYRPHGDGLVAYGFISELASRGHELHVAVENLDLRAELPANVHLHRLGPGPGPAPLDRIGFMWRMRRLYRRLARTAPFDLVHQLNPVDVGLTLAIADAGVPVVLGPYVPEWPGSPKPGGRLLRPAVVRLNESLRAAQQRRATTVLLSTPAAASRLAVPEPRRPLVRVISGGIDDRKWMPPADAISDGDQDVLFLGNLHLRKGILVLIDAFAEVARTLPRARLLVAGDGPLRAELSRRIAASPGLNRVELLGAVERERAVAVMQRCSVYCSPSLGEPFGMTALEAMACAKPVVATNAGGLGHLVPDGGGRKVAPGDPAALAAALKEVLPDFDGRRAMGAHNRRTVEERYSWRAIVDRLEGAYSEAVARRHS